MYENGNGGLSATDAMLLTNGNRGGSDYERSRIEENINKLRRM